MQRYEDIAEEVSGYQRENSKEDLVKRCLKRRALRSLETVLSEEDSESAHNSIGGLRIEHSFHEMSHGFSTEESEMEDLKQRYL